MYAGNLVNAVVAAAALVAVVETAELQLDLCWQQHLQQNRHGGSEMC
jgi:hypothetical protein